MLGVGVGVTSVPAMCGAARWQGHAAGGLVPDLVADFVADNYRAGGFGTGFDGLLVHARASDATYIDSTGTIQTAAVDAPRLGNHVWTGTAWVNAGLLIETESRTNLLLGSDAPVTQDVVVTAQPYTLSFTGSGSISLSGASTAGPLVGTGSGEANRVRLTFTPATGTLTLTVAGDVQMAQLEAGATQSSYIPTAGSSVTRAADSLTIPAAKLPYSSVAMSIAMDGQMTYADGDAAVEVVFGQWVADASNLIQIRLNTAAANLGAVQPLQIYGGVVDFVLSAADAYSAGSGIPFSIASRHGSTFINGAVDGTVLAENATPTALPDLSAAVFRIAYDFMGTISTFRMWGADIGDAGIAEASG